MADQPATQFRWHDLTLPYWDHEHNNTRNNERAVELPAAAWWLGQLPPDAHAGQHVGLEVGNVLAHYGAPPRRRVVDLTEVAEGVDNIDVADVRGQYPWIISISTIEHVGQMDYADTPVPMAATNALLHLRDLLIPGGRMLVTVPLGWNRDLDADIATGVFDVARQCTLHRIQVGDQPPVWLQASEPVAPLPYDHPAASAAAVWIGEW